MSYNTNIFKCPFIDMRTNLFINMAVFSVLELSELESKWESFEHFYLVLLFPLVGSAASVQSLTPQGIVISCFDCSFFLSLLSFFTASFSFPIHTFYALQLSFSVIL